MEQEDFIEIKKFNIFIFTIPRPCWGVEFIIKES